MRLDPNKVKLAIAPIGWTNDDLPELGAENTFEQCVSEMALAGFKGSEIGNKYPQDTEVLKHKLDVRGLRICNAWFSTLFTSQPYEVTEEAFLKHVIACMPWARGSLAPASRVTRSRASP